MFLVVICVVLLTRNLKPGPTPTDILPADTVGTVELEDLAGKMQVIEKSPIGQQVLGADFPYILLQLGLPLSQVTTFVNIRRALLPLTTGPVFKTLFSGHTTLALLSAEPGGQEQTSPLVRRIAVVTQFPVDMDFNDILPDFIKEKYKVSTSAYQGVEMLHIDLSDEVTLTVAQHQGLLISGFSSLSVTKCLDEAISRIVRPVTGLWLNWRYSRFKQQAADSSDFFLYAKVDDILSLLSDDPSVKDGFPSHWGIPEYVVASFWQDEGDVSRIKVRTLFPEKVLPAFQDRYGLRHPVNDERALSLPWDTQLYFRTSWFNMIAMWQAALKKNSLPRAAVLVLLAQRVYEYTGLPVNEFLELFGPQLTVYINDFGGDDAFPVPKLSFSIEVTEQERLAILLNRLLEDLPQRQEMAGGVPYVALQLGRGLMQPSYAFVDKTFLVADAREQLVSLLTAEGDALSDQDDYRAVDIGFGQSNIFEGFIRTSMLNKALYGLLAWVEKSCLTSSDDCAQRTGLMVQYLFRPLLESFDSVKTNGIRGYLQGDSVIVEAAFYATEQSEPSSAQPPGNQEWNNSLEN